MKIKNILLLLLLIIFGATIAYAGPAEEARLKNYFKTNYPNLPEDQLEAITEAARVVTNDELFQYTPNEYYKESLENGERLNSSNYTEYEVLAYGARYGKPEDQFDQGEKRYLGHTAMGEAYTNTFFRPDFIDGIQIDKANWLWRPHENDLVVNFLKQMNEPELKNNLYFNYEKRYRENILYGLIFLTFIDPVYYKFDEATWDLDKDWENYVHILQPPSKYCWGTGRMFRQLPGGSIRYMDVPLVSFSDLLLDFAVNLQEESFKANPGEVIESTSTFDLNPECPIPREARLRIYIKTSTGEIDLPFTPADPAKKMNGNKYTFQPNEKLEIKFSFTVPGEPAEIIARIDRVSKMRYWIEKNTANNEDRAPVVSDRHDVKAEVYPAQPSFTSINGGNTPVRFVVRISRKDDTPGVIPVPAVMSGPGGNYPVNPRLGPGESREYPYEFPGAPGCYTVEADAWPEGVVDACPGDNHASAEACVKYKEFKVNSKIRGDLIDVGGW